jgi:hypothetical protein
MKRGFPMPAFPGSKARFAALVLVPVLASTAWAQAPALPGPPQSTQPSDAVDKALRARASEFLQDFVDKQYRKALKFVAEESQDFYFGSAKAELMNFKLGEIKYSPDFQQATVYFTSDRSWKVHFEGAGEIPLRDVQMSSTWKMEDGQWCWYYRPESDPWITPMGPSNPSLISKKADGTFDVPAINQKTADAAAGAILGQTNVDKTVVTLAGDKESSDKFVIHNTLNGQVTLELLSQPKLPGFTVKLSRDALNAGEEAVVEVSYAPPADRDLTLATPGQTFGVAMHPFERIFALHVDFTPPPKK